jgi:subtilisin family serine protease
MLLFVRAERVPGSLREWSTRSGGRRTYMDDPERPAAGTTGKYLVLMREDALEEGVRTLRDAAGLTVAASSDFDDGAVEGETLAEAEAVVFEDLAVALVDTPPDQMQALGAAAQPEESPTLVIEPERVVYALQDGFPQVPTASPARECTWLPADFLRGYRDAVNHLTDMLLAEAGLTAEVSADGVAASLVETTDTWGLQVTGASASHYSGDGIRVAVLDTGIDELHPDFAGRSIESRSFAPNQGVQDGHGHGTHCIGTSCGPRQPNRLPRYGVASGAEIFVGKVLSNQGSGGDGGILAGMNWAISNGCQVISMSLGAPVQPGQRYSLVYELVGRRAFWRGALIVAAAGNESERPAIIAPIGHPANCPSIMSVAALDARLGGARYSCRGINPGGGQVDIAGPGVDVQSSWPRPSLYRRISGTSMATPHVAGIAALYAEAFPETRGRGLWALLIQKARRLTLPSRDVGIGLVEAP